MPAFRCYSPGMFRKVLILALFFFSSGPAWATSFASPTVPINDPVYRDVDKLVASGLVSDVLYGQRPWSRSEIGRIVGDSLKSKKEKTAFIESLLERLSHDYRDELVEQGYREGETPPVQVHWIDQSRFSYTYLDSPDRTVPVNNGVGSVDAKVNPLVAYQEGRHFADGHTFSLETDHWVKLSRYFSAEFRPDFRFMHGRDANDRAGFYVQNLYGRFVFDNLAIKMGRDNLVWGQGEHGGHLLTNNARPLDAIQLSNDSPFYHPGLFKYLGPSRYSFFIANMGPEREYPYTFLTGWKVSIKPFSFLELGGANTYYLGGDGAPALEWYDPAVEFFMGRIGIGSRNVADHRISGEFRLFIPPWRNGQIYGEASFEDAGWGLFILSPTYWVDTSAYLLGAYIPLLDSSGRLSLRIEYEHLSPIFGRHETWSSGHSLNRYLMGSALGPDSDRLALDLRFGIRPASSLDLSLAWEESDNDTVNKIYDSASQADYRSLDDGVLERRFRGVLSWEERFLSCYELKTYFGLERVVSVNFNPVENGHGFLLGLALKTNY